MNDLHPPPYSRHTGYLAPLDHNCSDGAVDITGIVADSCINIRLPTYGGIYAWEFEKRGRGLKVRVDGQLVFNTITLRMNAVLAGLGLAYLPEDQVQAHLADGRLIRVLADWCAPFSGDHLYYPSRRQPTTPSPCWLQRCGLMPFSCFSRI